MRGPAVDLSRFSKTVLGNWPTPLEDCPHLSQALGGPRILVKRDDVNGLGIGGNKLRKLEFLLGAALADGADTVVTFGGLQTNHGRQTAAACARLGLRCELVLTRQVTRRAGTSTLMAPRDDEAYERSGNVALDLLYGARIHVCDDDQQTEATHRQIVEEAAREGRRVVTFPVGGSNPLGVLGYLTAAAELKEQLADVDVDVDRIVLAIGSAGTAAGLAIGTALLDWPVMVDAASVSNPAPESAGDIKRLVDETAALLEVPTPALAHVQVTDRTLGSGYGLPSPAVWDAIRLFGRTEGITLDPVYTGKAAAALVEGVRTGEIPATETVVFLHTGGLPGLFGYASEFIDEAERGSLARMPPAPQMSRGLPARPLTLSRTIPGKSYPMGIEMTFAARITGRLVGHSLLAGRHLPAGDHQARHPSALRQHRRADGEPAAEIALPRPPLPRVADGPVAGRAADAEAHPHVTHDLSLARKRGAAGGVRAANQELSQPAKRALALHRPGLGYAWHVCRRPVPQARDRRIGARALPGAAVAYGTHINHSGTPV